MPKTYAILGTGAMGGFYGARLQRAGLDVHFLLHGDYQHVRQHGLRVNSVDGDFSLPQVNAYRDSREMPACDVVILALKTTHNHLLPELLPPLLKPDSVVLVLQNGLGSEPQVAEVAGPERVMGGLCFLCSNKTGPGEICHLDYGEVSLGEYLPEYRAGGITPRMRELAADFERTGLTVRLEPDLYLARWRKLMWNIPFNGLSVALGATTAEMMADPCVRQLAAELMQEVRQGARAGGREIEVGFCTQLMEATASMKPYKTSMKLDYEQGRPLELEAIFAYPLSVSKHAGVDLVRTRMLYRQLSFLDAHRRAAEE